MNTPEDAFTKLLGRQPTDKEKQGLLRARDALDLKNNDALWLLVMALGHYETLYARFPALIKQAATDVMAKSKEAADAEFQAAATRAHRDLSKAVAASAHEIAGRAASATRWRWLAIGVTASLASFAVMTTWVSRLADRAGYAAGRLQGYAAARDEIAAASWANTPEGQVAFGLSKAGSIRLLADCSGKGWVRHDDVCYPKANKEGLQGWRVLP